MSIMSDRDQEYREYENEDLYGNKRRNKIEFILNNNFKGWSYRKLASVSDYTLDGIYASTIKKLKNKDSSHTTKSFDLEDEFDQEYYEMLENDFENDRGRSL